MLSSSLKPRFPSTHPPTSTHRNPANRLTVLAGWTIIAYYPTFTNTQQQVDFAHYKNIIKNQKIVSELEQSFKSFKPVDYDVAAQLKAIDAFQEKAVGLLFLLAFSELTHGGTPLTSNAYHSTITTLLSLTRGYISCKQVTSAQQAAKKVDQELQALQSTLKDIESARPFEDLTTADVARARPEITKAVEEMVKHGKWTTPGYGEKVGLRTTFFLITHLWCRCPARRRIYPLTHSFPSPPICCARLGIIQFGNLQAL